jgi:hypothetical protein
MKSQAFMTRASKALEDYERMDWKGTEAAFYPSDIQNIIDNAHFQETGGYVMDALHAGFMIGYRKGLRDARKKAAAK